MTSGELERALRDAVAQHQLRSVPVTRSASGPGPGGGADPTERGRLADVAGAVRAACAYLDAGDPAEAHLALRCQAVGELAADLVAGRVAPGAVPSAGGRRAQPLP